MGYIAVIRRLGTRNLKTIFSWFRSVLAPLNVLSGEVPPQVDFAKEDFRQPRYSLRFALEVLFGGETRRLL